MKQIVLWGTGKIANRLLISISEKIVLVVDNDEKKWGTVWNGYTVSSPEALKMAELRFDKIVIATEKWRVIRKQIIEKFNIDDKLIDNMYYQHKERLLQRYEDIAALDKKNYISYLKRHPLAVFNDDFTDKYIDFNVDVHFDTDCLLYYVCHNNKKMYLSSDFTNEEQVKAYYCFLCMEQDILSPHRYQTDIFRVSKGDVVLDVGVAEGNFALDVVDIVDKIYLIESNEKWIEALKRTFAPYMDKVELIHEFIGLDKDTEVTIDSILHGHKVDFIKMDIEGSEVRALMGAKQVLKENDVKLAVCAYHNIEDEEKIKKILWEIGYQTEVSEGYMIFIPDRLYEKKDYKLDFVRGLVRGSKNI